MRKILHFTVEVMKIVDFLILKIPTLSIET